jgi:PKD repeat protein
MTGLTPSTTYHVRAYATNALGTGYGSDVVFSTLCEPLAPITNFGSNFTTISVGQSVNFYDSTRYCPSSWNWSFVGGIPYSSAAPNPTAIVYNYPGVYNVCLTTTNAYGTSTLCKSGYITVNGPLNSKMVVTEIMYNPPESGVDSLEFIELYNNDTATVNLQGFYFANPVTYTFPNYTVAPHSYVLIAKSASAMFHTFGVTALQWATGSLSNSGALVKLKDKFNATVDSVQYGTMMPWDTLANGHGPSLELCDPNSNNALAANWRHGVEFAAVNAAHDTIWASPGAGCSYPPVANFAANQTHIHLTDFVQFADSSSGQVNTWKWEFEGGTPSSSNLLIPPPVKYTAFGTYDVTLTVGNNAGENSLVKSAYIVVGTTGIETLGGENPFLIFPNPAEGKFSVIFANRESCEVRIISGMGNVVEQRQSAGETLEFDLSGFSSGIYVVQVFDNATLTLVSKKLILK